MKSNLRSNLENDTETKGKQECLLVEEKVDTTKNDLKTEKKKSTNSIVNAHKNASYNDSPSDSSKPEAVYQIYLSKPQKIRPPPNQKGTCL